MFISGSFHSVFLDCGWPWVIETTESETTDKGRRLYFSFLFESSLSPPFLHHKDFVNKDAIDFSFFGKDYKRKDQIKSQVLFFLIRKLFEYKEPTCSYASASILPPWYLPQHLLAGLGVSKVTNNSTSQFLNSGVPSKALLLLYP